MSSAENIENLIRNLHDTTSADMDKRILRDTLKVLEQSEKAKPALVQPNIWRIIMKARITKLAAAAAIIIAVLIGIHQLGGSVTTTAYAIEQTIEAMHSINSIHAYCTDWDNSRGEVWVQINPETGEEEYYYADVGNLLIVGTPQATYYYYKDENRVRIRNEYVPASDIRFSRFFEDLVGWVQQYHGELWFYFQFDEELQQEVIMVHGSIPTQIDFDEKEFIFRVDPRTKLPINLEMLKCGPGEGVKSVDSVEYNVPIPEGIFEFEVPDGAKVVYEGKDKEAG